MELFAAVLSTLLAPIQQASAMKITSQEFTGGMVKGGGSSPKSSTAASAEGYTLDGEILVLQCTPPVKSSTLHLKEAGYFCWRTMILK